MSASAHFTAEEFAEQLFDLPDAGRWLELEAGEIVPLEPPDDVHGNIVLNASKALAVYLNERRDDPPGYACFEIGLIVSRFPDTVRRPAVSFFSSKSLFAESDRLVTDNIPQVILEAATTKRRRQFVKSRVEEYHRLGVEHVWVADPLDRLVHVCERGRTPRQLTEGRTLHGEPFLPGFALSIADLFAEPSWWSSTR